MKNRQIILVVLIAFVGSVTLFLHLSITSIFVLDRENSITQTVLFIGCLLLVFIVVTIGLPLIIAWWRDVRSKRFAHKTEKGQIVADKILTMIGEGVEVRKIILEVTRRYHITDKRALRIIKSVQAK